MKINILSIRINTLTDFLNYDTYFKVKFYILIFLFLSQLLFCFEIPDGIEAQAVYVFDINTNEPLLERSCEDVLFPASLTKLLTAYILSKTIAPEDILYYSSLAKQTDPYKLDLPIGEQVLASQAMDALLIWSANDIATMIAENVGGNLYGFSELMNREAQDLGMENSHFVTPHGLHDPAHYTTAFDMSLLLGKVYQNSWIRESMRKSTMVFYKNNGEAITLKNRNKLTGRYECIGGKTGWTEEAGRCLAAIFKHQDKIWGAIIMNTIYDYPQDTIVFNEMLSIIDVLKQKKPVSLKKQGDVVSEIQEHFNLFNFFGPAMDIKIKAKILQDVKIVNPDLAFVSSVNFLAIDSWNLDKNKSIGTYKIKYRNYEAEYLIYPENSTLDIIRGFWHIYLLIIGIVLSLSVMTIAIVKIIRKGNSGAH